MSPLSSVSPAPAAMGHPGPELRVGKGWGGKRGSKRCFRAWKACHHCTEQGLGAWQGEEHAQMPALGGGEAELG